MKRNYATRLLLAAMACMLLIAPLTATAEEAKAERIFGRSFVEACNLSSGIGDNRTMTVYGNNAYMLRVDGDIYTWDPDTGVYAYWAHVPAVPYFDVEIKIDQQPESLQQEIRENVSRLIPSDDGIYGFNDRTGKVGPVDETGWHPQDCRMDVSRLFQTTNNYPQNLRQMFISQGKIYAFHDINLASDERPETELLIFDLSTGVCTPISMPDTYTFCPYTPGKLLCMQGLTTKSPYLAVYDINTQSFTSLGITVPLTFSEKMYSSSMILHSQASGLAYDADRNTIYLAGEESLWHSFDGAAFEAVRITDGWAEKEVIAEAWVLSSGGYVTRNGWPYYIAP